MKAEAAAPSEQRRPSWYDAEFVSELSAVEHARAASNESVSAPLPQTCAAAESGSGAPSGSDAVDRQLEALSAELRGLRDALAETAAQRRELSLAARRPSAVLLLDASGGLEPMTLAQTEARLTSASELREIAAGIMRGYADSDDESDSSEWSENEDDATDANAEIPAAAHARGGDRWHSPLGKMIDGAVQAVSRSSLFAGAGSAPGLPDEGSDDAGEDAAEAAAARFRRRSARASAAQRRTANGARAPRRTRRSGSEEPRPRADQPSEKNGGRVPPAAAAALTDEHKAPDGGPADARARGRAAPGGARTRRPRRSTSLPPAALREEAASPAGAPAVSREEPAAGTRGEGASPFDRLLARKDMVILEQEHALRLLLLQLEEVSAVLRPHAPHRAEAGRGVSLANRVALALARFEQRNEELVERCDTLQRGRGLASTGSVSRGVHEERIGDYDTRKRAHVLVQSGLTSSSLAAAGLEEQRPRARESDFSETHDEASAKSRRSDSAETNEDFLQRYDAAVQGASDDVLGALCETRQRLSCGAVEGGPSDFVPRRVDHPIS